MGEAQLSVNSGAPKDQVRFRLHSLCIPCGTTPPSPPLHRCLMVGESIRFFSDAFRLPVCVGDSWNLTYPPGQGSPDAQFSGSPVSDPLLPTGLGVSPRCVRTGLLTAMTRYLTTTSAARPAATRATSSAAMDAHGRSTLSASTWCSRSICPTSGIVTSVS